MNARVKVADARAVPPATGLAGISASLRGLGPLLRFNLLGIRRSWPGLMVIGVFVFLAVLSPITARWTPELLASLAPDMPITLPDPSWVDSAQQWAKNLNQIGVLLAIVVTAGAIAGEVRDGTAVLVLTKPASRAAYVLAAFIAPALLVAGAAGVGTLLAWGLTAALFPATPLLPFVGVSAVWLVLALMVMAATVWASGLASGPLPAVGVGIAVWLVLTVGGVWDVAYRYTPAGLSGLVGKIAAGGGSGGLGGGGLGGGGLSAGDLVWPLVTGALAVVLLLAGAVASFRRREL